VRGGDLEQEVRERDLAGDRDECRYVAAERPSTIEARLIVPIWIPPTRVKAPKASRPRGRTWWWRRTPSPMTATPTALASAQTVETVSQGEAMADRS
jgi:hypothetical protein